MFSPTRSLLANGLAIGRWVVPMAFTAYLGFEAGSVLSDRAHQAQITQLTQAHGEDLLAAQTARNAELALAMTEQQRLSDIAHQLGWQLLQTQGDLNRTQVQLKKRISHAAQQDGPRFTGLGPDSLRLYQTALGYPERNSGLPTTDATDDAETGQAANTGEGLPPEDLLAHATDYGRWCLETNARLSAFIDLHQESRDGHL